MPLMGSLYIGASGLQTSQNALNTTAHNLSNTDTVGYTRQQVQQTDKAYITISRSASASSYQQVGLGTTYARAKQVRDYFLDKTYRKESGRLEFYNTSYKVMEEVEAQLGELTGEAFQTNISDFWTSVQELVKDPTSSVTQGLFVQRAAEFVERASAVYEGLSSYQDNLNRQVKQQVDKINEYGQKLLTLNDQIRTIESGGVEQANDYRDARNLLLDELASLTDISWAEDLYGNVTVKIEGVDFVKGGQCYEIGLKVSETTGFYTPFWPQNAEYKVLENGTRDYDIDGAIVFDLDKEISSDKNTDIGKLKAMLLARGDHRADYTDIRKDYDAVSQSVVMNIQAEFDQLIHAVATKINGILAEAAGQKTGDLMLANGTQLKGVSYVEAEPNGYLRKDDGSPIQVFSKATTDSYDKVVGADGKTYFVYRPEDMTEQDSLYSIKNLQIDRTLMQKPSMLGFKKTDSAADTETVEKLRDAFTEEIYTLNPKVQKRTTFMDYYSDLVSQVANSGSVYKGIYTNQEDTVEYTKSARDQVLGVSSDEELSNMVKLQNAYNAASRYINSISEMLEHIINTLAV